MSLCKVLFHVILPFQSPFPINYTFPKICIKNLNKKYLPPLTHFSLTSLSFFVYYCISLTFLSFEILCLIRLFALSIKLSINLIYLFSMIENVRSSAESKSVLYIDVIVQNNGRWPSHAHARMCDVTRSCAYSRLENK